MKRYGLIGFPLSHSFSEGYFTEKFQKHGLTDCRYQLFPLQHLEQFAPLIRDYPDLLGLNVTIPWKEQVIPLLHHLDESARLAGAVNVITINRGSTELRLTGYNTDAPAFRETIRPLLRSNHQRALILGTGGAAKAVASVLKQLHIDYLFVSRNPAAGQVAYSELNAAAVAGFPFIINCTPAGMTPDTHGFPPIPYEHLDSRNFLYDLVYNPAETEFLRKGRERGALVQNGLPMLHRQAELAWAIWQEAERK